MPTSATARRIPASQARGETRRLNRSVVPAPRARRAASPRRRPVSPTGSDHRPPSPLELGPAILEAATFCLANPSLEAKVRSQLEELWPGAAVPFGRAVAVARHRRRSTPRSAMVAAAYGGAASGSRAEPRPPPRAAAVAEPDEEPAARPRRGRPQQPAPGSPPSSLAKPPARDGRGRPVAPSPAGPITPHVAGADGRRRAVPPSSSRTVPPPVQSTPRAPPGTLIAEARHAALAAANAADAAVEMAAGHTQVMSCLQLLFDDGFIDQAHDLLNTMLDGGDEDTERIDGVQEVVELGRRASSGARDVIARLERLDVAVRASVVDGLATTHVMLSTPERRRSTQSGTDIAMGRGGGVTDAIKYTRWAHAAGHTGAGSPPRMAPLTPSGTGSVRVVAPASPDSPRPMWDTSPPSVKRQHRELPKTPPTPMTPLRSDMEEMLSRRPPFSPSLPPATPDDRVEREDLVRQVEAAASLVIQDTVRAFLARQRARPRVLTPESAAVRLQGAVRRRLAQHACNKLRVRRGQARQRLLRARRDHLVKVALNIAAQVCAVRIQRAARFHLLLGLGIGRGLNPAIAMYDELAGASRRLIGLREKSEAAGHVLGASVVTPLAVRWRAVMETRHAAAVVVTNAVRRVSTGNALSRLVEELAAASKTVLDEAVEAAVSDEACCLDAVAQVVLEEAIFPLAVSALAREVTESAVAQAAADRRREREQALAELAAQEAADHRSEREHALAALAAQETADRREQELAEAADRRSERERALAALAAQETADRREQELAERSERERALAALAEEADRKIALERQEAADRGAAAHLTEFLGKDPPDGQHEPPSPPPRPTAATVRELAKKDDDAVPSPPPRPIAATVRALAKTADDAAPSMVAGEPELPHTHTVASAPAPREGAAAPTGQPRPGGVASTAAAGREDDDGGAGGAGVKRKADGGGEAPAQGGGEAPAQQAAPPPEDKARAKRSWRKAASAWTGIKVSKSKK